MELGHMINLYNLTEIEAGILKYLDDNRHTLDTMNVRKVAQACYTSPSTIINLAKKLQLSGFSELVFQMKRSDENQNTLKNLASEKIDLFCEILSQNENKLISIVSTGFSNHVAAYMCDVLNFHGIPCIMTTHMELFQVRKEQEVIPVFVSHSGEEQSLLQFLKKCREQELKIVSFTGNHESSIAKQSTLTFSSNTYSPFSIAISQPQFFFGDTLTHFEIIISQFLNRVRI